MKVISISIENYRSILNAKKIPINDKLIIIGQNNEGKSNILHGLVLCLSMICHNLARRARRMGVVRQRFGVTGSTNYDWERDYPIALQESQPEGTSNFTIDFEITPEQREDFEKVLKLTIPNILSFSLQFGSSEFRITENVSGEIAPEELAKNHELLSSLFDKYLVFQYIPAIRPIDFSISIIGNLLESEMSVLDENDEYKKLLKSIEKLQKPILNSLSNSLSSSIKEFIPDVKGVEISMSESLRRVISRSLQIFVDDNVRTNIQQKGDGIKSLIAISLVRHTLKGKDKSKSIILALEEPESHLHPGAIHRLNRLLNEISQSQQVVITTHSPLLVDRLNLEKNVLVNRQSADPAMSISEIRKIIGVQISDNLVSAKWIFLCEGQSDIIILKKWLSEDPIIREFIDGGHLAFDSLNGGSNLGYKISQYNSMLCSTIAFLDHDPSGQKAFDAANRKGLIELKDVVFSMVSGRSVSEIEDMIQFEIYKELIANKYGVRLEKSKFKGNDVVWSDRMRDYFKRSGKIWTDNIEEKIKLEIALYLESIPDLGIVQGAESTIESLITSLKERMK